MRTCFTNPCKNICEVSYKKFTLGSPFFLTALKFHCKYPLRERDSPFKFIFGSSETEMRSDNDSKLHRMTGAPHCRRYIALWGENQNFVHKFLLITRLNMLFTPMLPVKAEFAAILRIQSNAENSEQFKTGC